MQLQPILDDPLSNAPWRPADKTTALDSQAASSHSCYREPPDVTLDFGGPVDRPFVRTGELFPDKPAIDHLRSVAARYANRAALSDAFGSVTYADFLRSVLQLAHAIVAVTAEGDAVGSLLGNSIWQPVAMLACMAAGRPLVPLNSRDPGRRLAEITSIARITVMVTQGDGHADEWSADAKLHWINIESMSEPNGGGAPLPAIAVDAPALVLYTSGSTGQPKGVVNSQRALLQRVHQYVDAGHINAADVLMPLSGSTTIAGCREVLSALLTGARLHIVDVETLGLRGVLRDVRAQRVTISYIVPALMRALVAASAPGDFDSLRIVRIGGEKVLRTDIDLIRRVIQPSCLLQISYSSTETTGTQWFLPSDWEEQDITVPVGYLLPGLQYAVLNEDGRPVPAGSVGELVIRSRYVLLGHWMDGHLSHTQADPEDPSLRIFPTGDLVSVDAHGLMRVIGRKGRQLKINGRRIEPAELETVLRGISVVRDAATIVSDSNELVAFVSPASPAPSTFTADVRDVIRQTLPSALHPTRLHEIAEIPRMAGGKVDNARLKEIDLESRTPVSAPQVPTMTKMAEAWEAVHQVWNGILGTAQATGRWDESGGDSLKLLRCIMELETLIGHELNMEAFTVDMTAAEMISVVANIEQPEVKGSKAVMPCLFMLPGSMGYGPSLAAFGAHLGKVAHVIPIRYPDLAATLSGTGEVDEIATLAIEQIKAAQPHGDIRLIGYSLGGGVAFEIASRLIAEGRLVKFLGILDTNIGPRKHNYHEALSRTMQRIVSHRVTIHRMLCRAVSKYIASLGWQVGFCRFLDSRFRNRFADTRFILKLELEEVLRMQAFDRWRTMKKGRLPITGTIFSCNRRLGQIGLGWEPLFANLEVIPIAGGHLDLVVEPHVTVNLPVIQRALSASYA